jgi:hypothetical protein
MTRYRVTRRYSAVYRSQPIAFDKGAIVDVDDETADWVNNDSPGCLDPHDLLDEPDDSEPSDDTDDSDPADDPAAADDPEPTEGVRTDDMSHDELVAAVQQLDGVDGDPARWGDKRLRETLAAAAG